jgi:uncharacterized integral membrane protein
MARTTESTRYRAEAGEDQQGVMARLRMGAGVVAVAALALFFLQNLQEVDIHFLWFDWTTRMLWALLVSAAVGALAALAFGMRRPREREQR